MTAAIHVLQEHTFSTRLTTGKEGREGREEREEVRSDTWENVLPAPFLWKSKIAQKIKFVN